MSASKRRRSVEVLPVNQGIAIDGGMGFNEYDLMSSICRDSFWEFLKEMWDVIIPERPHYNWHIKYICDEMQEAAERVFRMEPKLYDIIINVPPGTTKSTIASVMFPAWTWTRMPSARHICGSFTERLALDLSRKSRDVVKSEKYMTCFPYVALREDQDTKGYFVNTRGGIRYAVGVGGSVMGMHGHFVNIDDPIDPIQAISDIELAAANTWCTEQLSQRLVDKDVSLFTIIQQRLHQDDPTGARLANTHAGPVRHICLPCDDSWEISPPELVKNYHNGLLDPTRLSRPALERARAVLGEVGYAGQMGQRPIPRGGGMFKVDRIHRTHTAPTKFKRKCRFWDKAGTRGGGAYTAGVLIAQDMEGKFWILDVMLGQWDSGTREKLIHETAKADGVSTTVGQEVAPGDAGKEAAEATVKRLVGFRVKSIPTGGKSKEERAEPFSQQVNVGNVHVLERHWTDKYITELEYFPLSKYKDQVDASSGGFSVLSKPLIKVGGLGR